MPDVSPLSAVDDLPPARVALEVAARSEEVAAVRKAIGDLARSAGASEDCVADITLAVGEACANAVVHAFADRPPGVLRITGEMTDGGLQIVVADDGQGMSPRPDSPGLGLGLPLMASLAATMDVRAASTGGTEIWMVFDVGGPAASACLGAHGLSAAGPASWCGRRAPPARFGARGRAVPPAA
jgi:serine/threonine-protein kinase RsbW/stage II sporulation protein AB (anti-sigma F factor)